MGESRSLDDPIYGKVSPSPDSSPLINVRDGHKLALSPLLSLSRRSCHRSPVYPRILLRERSELGPNVTEGLNCLSKIRRDLVKYSTWLNAGTLRAPAPLLVSLTCSRVQTFSGMNRGFLVPPDPHLVVHRPMQLNGLDENVTYGMGGFGFGTVREVEKTSRGSVI